MQGNEAPYNHNADKMGDAIGIDLPNFRKKVDAYNEAHRERMVPSEIVESLEAFFTPRELAFMFWNETFNQDAVLAGSDEETADPGQNNIS